MSEQPETESQSIEDRLYAQFGEQFAESDAKEESAAPEPQEAEPQETQESAAVPEFVDIEYEGKSYQVPPELKDAILRQSDYTKKTTEVSERQRALEQRELQIKAVDSERQFHESVKGDVSQIQEIDFQIKQWRSVDVTGMTSEQLWQVKTQIDNLKEKREELSRGINGKWSQFQQQQQQLAQDMRAKATEFVSKAIKGWGPGLQKELTDYGVSEGYTSEELSSLSMDARIVKTLWKARQFDKLQAQTINGKVSATPTIKPGSSNPMPQAVKDKLAYTKQMKSAQTSSQKAKVIERELMNRF